MSQSYAARNPPRPAMRRLGLLFVAAVAALFMLLVLAFGRARDALIVMVLPLESSPDD